MAEYGRFYLVRNNINKVVKSSYKSNFLASRHKDSIFSAGVFQLGTPVIQTLFNIVKSAFKFPIAAQ